MLDAKQLLGEAKKITGTKQTIKGNKRIKLLPPTLKRLHMTSPIRAFP